MKRVVEVCCYTVEDVLLAYEAGAGRVELCADSARRDYPSLGLVEYVVQNVPIEVSVMIRPRGGDFAYSQAELDIMERILTGLRRQARNVWCLGFSQRMGSQTLIQWPG